MTPRFPLEKVVQRLKIVKGLAAIYKRSLQLNLCHICHLFMLPLCMALQNKRIFVCGKIINLALGDVVVLRYDV